MRELLAFMRSARESIVATALIVLFGAIALGSKPVTAADPFVIPAILPITGIGAFSGKDYAKTLMALEEYTNRAGGIRGRPIRFDVLDDQSQPQIAVQLMNQAIADKSAAVIGPGTAGECGAVLALVKAGPVTYCMSPGIHPEPGSFMFSAGFSTVDLINRMIRYARDRGYKRIAIISTTDASGQDGERSIDAALSNGTNNDVVVVAREHFAPADISVSAQTSRIKAAAPDAVIAWASGTPVGTFLRAVRESGLDVPIFTTPANQTYEQMAAYADIMPSALLFPSGPFAAPDQLTDRVMRTAVQSFSDSLTAVHARADFPNQQPWDAGQLIVAAYRKYGTDATANQIHDYISSLAGWIGQNGRYDFVATPQRGLDGSSTVIARWDAAKGTWAAASKLGGEPLK